MPLRTRVQPIQKDVQLLLDEFKSPQQRSKALAQFAHDEIEDAKKINRRALGYDPPVTIYVDGNKSISIESVKNVVVADFELIGQLVLWVHGQLQMHSPVRTGKYKRSHTLFADGHQVEPIGPEVPVASEYVFVNLVPYARKIERGSSSQAPDGVYQVVAHLAQQQFRGVGRITFSYRTVLEGLIVGGKKGDRSENRNPAIIIKGGL
jgi:hypothetical protein